MDQPLQPALARKQAAAEEAQHAAAQADRHAVLTALGTSGVAHLVHLRGLLGCSPLRLGDMLSHLEAEGYVTMDPLQRVRLSGAGARVRELERDHA